MFKKIRSYYKLHDSTILNPALWAVLNYHFGVWSMNLKFSPLRWLTSKIYGLNAFFILITSGIRLHREVKIGSDFHLIHTGNIHIHPLSVIGDRCGIQQDVTLGTNMERYGAPIIGNDVYIGAGAKILGPVTVGDGARVASNSLVITDVPPGATAIGVPARMMKYTGRSLEKTRS
ncbi:MAG: serine O-acetyltransferase [Thiohalomonadales bacterium]